MFVFTIDDIFSWGLFGLAVLTLIVVSVFKAIGGAIQRFSDKRTKRAEEALESRAEKPTLCDRCECLSECKSKMEITTLRDDLRRFMPPFEGCVMTEGEKKGDKCNEIQHNNSRT